MFREPSEFGKADRANRVRVSPKSPSNASASWSQRGLIPAPRRTVGRLRGAGAAAGTVANSIAAGLKLGAGTGAAAAVAAVRLGTSVGGCVLRSSISASGPELYASRWRVSRLRDHQIMGLLSYHEARHRESA